MDYNRLMWLLLLIFNVFIYAEDQSIEKYCFSNPSEASLASNQLVSLILPSEEIVKQDSCLVLKLKTHRRDFIQAYTLKNFPNTQVTFSEIQMRKEACHLKVEKVKSKKSDHTNISVSKNLTADASSTQQQEFETMNIQTINEFEIMVDQKQVKGRCRFITKNLYEIKITVNQNPRPIVPANVPPGTIVVINSPPPDQETSSLSSEIQLNRGQRIELGSVLKKTNRNNKDASLNPDLTIDESNKLGEEKVYLSLE